MKNLSALLVVVLLAVASRGSAQDALSGNDAGELPPGLGMPGEEQSDLPLGQGAAPDSASVLEPTPEEISPQAVEDEFGDSLVDESTCTQGFYPTLFESSGTWLRRGYWYTEVDYMLMNRAWDKHGLILGREETVISGGNGQPPALLPYFTGNYLDLRGHSPGAEGMGRVKLGRFLFRDASNRDHSIEGDWVGGGDFQQNVSYTSPNVNSTTVSTPNNPVGIQVTDFVDRINPSFDGSGSMSVQYNSQVNTGEVNYIVKSRLHRDRMLLEPTGQWVRAATPTKTYAYLTGLRYLSLDEMLDWTATDRITTPSVLEGGHYTVQTHNQLFGGQLGGSLGYETARWSIIGTGKAGAYWNRINLRSSFDLNRTTALDGTVNERTDDLSFVGEAQLLAKWHLSPNVSLRTSLDLLFVDSIALAPYQVNFIPGGYTQIANGGDSVFMGTSFGVEAYW